MCDLLIFLHEYLVVWDVTPTDAQVRNLQQTDPFTSFLIHRSTSFVCVTCCVVLVMCLCV